MRSLAHLPSDAFEFGEFRVEPRGFLLLHRGQPLRIEPKAIEVLGVLLDQHGELVRRDELLDAIWGRAEVGYSTLTRLVADLRRLFDDDAAAPRFIQTTHRLGYRWIAPTRRVATQARRANVLPARRGRFIGRDDDVAMVLERLARSRLLTLIGPGGVGKTQLALEVVRRAETSYSHGAAMIDLAVSDSDSILRSIAGALNINESRSATLESTLCAVLARRQILLLLDNCELVHDAVAKLTARILASCQQTTVLCTSQRAIGLNEELLCPIAPLALPPEDWSSQTDPIGAVAAAPAAELLLDRARVAAPEFQLDAQNAADVVRICRRLDGMPLAIELAAPRLSVLTPAQLDSALADRLRTIARGASQDARHRSLSAALDWSYRMLRADERALLDRLSVFNGSWSLDAAEGVCGDDAGLLDLLQALVQKSLVSVDLSGKVARYRLLESVRDYGLHRLRENGEEENARRRHALFYRELALRSDPEFMSAAQLECVRRFRLETGNFRDAYTWSRARPQHHATAVDIAGGMRWFYWSAGLYSEALQSCADAFEVIGQASDAGRLRLLMGWGLALHHASHFESGEQRLGEARTLALQLQQPWEAALIAAYLSMNASMAGDLTLARMRADAARIEAQALNDALAAGCSDLASAFVRICSERGAAAIPDLVAALRSFEKAGNAHATQYVLLNLGLQRYRSGADDESAAAFARAWSISSQIPAVRAMAGACEGAAYLATSRGEHGDAAQLLGVADAGREASGSPLLPHWRETHDHCWTKVRDALGASTAASFFAAGQRAPIHVAGADLALRTLERAREGGLSATP